MKLFILLAMVSSLSAASINLIPYLRLPAFNFSKPGDGKSNYEGIEGIIYSPHNAFVEDIAVYEDRLFISFVKMSGIPATLTWLDLGLFFPSLHPFHSLNMHDEGNCANLQNVKAIKVDMRGQLWVIDHSWKDCRSRIWIFDLNDNDEVLFLHDLPYSIFPYQYLENTIVTLALYEEMHDTYAFMVENSYRSVVHVLSLKTKETWSVRIEGGRSLSGMALISPVGVNKLLYLSSWQGTTPELYTVPVSDLVQRKINSLTPTLIGNKTSGSYRLILDRKGMLYYDVRDWTVLCAWDTNLPFRERVVFQDKEQISPLRWYSRFTIDEFDDVWLLIRFYGGFKLHTSR